MSDALTDYLVGKTRSRSPFVMKWVPPSIVSIVMPFDPISQICSVWSFVRGGLSDHILQGFPSDLTCGHLGYPLLESPSHRE